MKKSVWMAQLDHALSREGLSGSEKRTVLNYYEEMFLDKRDDGMSEEEILREFGFPDDVAQSVRENESMERGGFRRGERRYSNECDDRGYNRFDDVNREPPYQNGYNGNGFNQNCYSSNVYTQNQGGYNQTPPPQQPPFGNYQNSQNPRKTAVFSSITELMLALVRVALVIALVVAGAGIIIGGGATAVASFLTFTQGFAVFLIVFGVGIILIACGCLIFAAGIKIAKGFSSQGGAK